MSYSVTVIHWQYKKNVRHLYPLKILVTVNGKGHPLHTPHKVAPEQWDNDRRLVKDHPNAESINADLRRLVAAKEADLLQATRAGEKITPELIRGIQRDMTLVGFAREISGKEKLDSRSSTEINRLMAYKGAGILLSDVDVAWLRKYDQHEKGRGMEQNTRNGTFKWLRKVFKQAAKEKLIRENPFDLFDIPQYIQPDTTYLVEEEKEALFRLLDQLDPGGLKNTLTYFLFACFAGPRHSDWHKFHEKDMVYEGFLRLRPKKRSRGFVVMPVGKTLEKLLQRIRDLEEPPYRTAVCNQHLSELFQLADVQMNGKVIRGIHKKATTHVARHSFGYLCASKGLPKSTTAELMGISVQTVEVYYHLSGENILKQAAALREV